MTCLISFSKFSDVLPAFTCAITIGKLLSFCLEHNILRFKRSETLAMQLQAMRVDIRGIPFPKVFCIAPKI